MKHRKDHKPLNKRTLAAACVSLAEADQAFRRVWDTYGTPPLWDRPSGFATLLQIILEQQVSLASAKACFDKLSAVITEVTPESVLSLSDGELKTAGFSRQKAAYARHLADAVIEHRIDLDRLHLLDDEDVKAELQKLKGVGIWTSDIYLIMVLSATRCDAERRPCLTFRMAKADEFAEPAGLGRVHCNCGKLAAVPISRSQAPVALLLVGKGERRGRRLRSGRKGSYSQLFTAVQSSSILRCMLVILFERFFNET